MKNKRNKVERCQSKATFLAYLDSHRWLQNETYYWTFDGKIKCQVCDQIIPTASKMNRHSKAIKHRKKLVDQNEKKLPSSIIYKEKERVSKLSKRPKHSNAISLSNVCTYVTNSKNNDLNQYISSSAIQKKLLKDIEEKKISILVLLIILIL